MGWQSFVAVLFVTQPLSTVSLTAVTNDPWMTLAVEPNVTLHQKIVAGSPVEVACVLTVADPNHNSTLEWSIELPGRQIFDASGGYHLVDHGMVNRSRRLVLTVSSFDNVHNGVYRCRANHGGVGLSTLVVLSVELPAMSMVYQQFQRLMLGSDDSVSCGVQSASNVQVFYFKDGEPYVPDRTRCRGGPDGLQFDVVVEQDAGTYLCLVREWSGDGRIAGNQVTVEVYRRVVPVNLTFPYYPDAEAGWWVTYDLDGRLIDEAFVEEAFVVDVDRIACSVTRRPLVVVTDPITAAPEEPALWPDDGDDGDEGDEGDEGCFRLGGKLIPSLVIVIVVLAAALLVVTIMLVAARRRRSYYPVTHTESTTAAGSMFSLSHFVGNAEKGREAETVAAKDENDVRALGQQLDKALFNWNKSTLAFASDDSLRFRDYSSSFQNFLVGNQSPSDRDSGDGPTTELSTQFEA